jgi:hypothetical protein
VLQLHALVESLLQCVAWWSPYCSLWNWERKSLQLEEEVPALE